MDLSASSRILSFLRNNGDGVALKLCDFGFYKQTAIPSCCPVSSLAFGTTFTGGKICWEEPGCGPLSKVPLDVADVNCVNKVWSSAGWLHGVLCDLDAFRLEDPLDISASANSGAVVFKALISTLISSAGWYFVQENLPFQMVGDGDVWRLLL